MDNNQCIFKDRGQLRLGSPAYGIDPLRRYLTDRASGSPADAQASAGTQVDGQKMKRAAREKYPVLQLYVRH